MELIEKLAVDLDQLIDLPTVWSTREDLAKLIYAVPGIADRIINVPESPESVINQLFWKNSWQLTNSGIVAFYTTYNSFRVKNDVNYRVTGRVLINLGRLLKGPWHIQHGTVYTWNRRAHFELMLMDGDIHRYIESNLPDR